MSPGNKESWKRELSWVMATWDVDTWVVGRAEAHCFGTPGNGQGWTRDTQRCTKCVGQREQQPYRERDSWLRGEAAGCRGWSQAREAWPL